LVKSVNAIVYSGVQPVKVAEADINFFRLPFATDDELKQGTIETCKKAFDDQGLNNLSAINPRLRKVNDLSWISTVDIVESSTVAPRMPPVQGIISWGLIAYLITGIILGWLVTKWIIYWVKIKPLEEALQEVVVALDTIIDNKHDRLAAGYITQEYSDELDAQLEEARDNADDAGDDPQMTWVDYFMGLNLGQYVPWVIGGAIALSILATIRVLAPRR